MRIILTLAGFTALALAIHYGMALAGEPQSLWFMQLLGVL